MLKQSCEAFEHTMVFTDYEFSILESLSNSIATQFTADILKENETVREYGATVLQPRLKCVVKTLDWTWFDQNEADMIFTYDKLSELECRFPVDSADLILGSALVYAPCHACVADVLHYFRTCKSAYIIQVRSF